jgi:two-component sensor histidine kinase
VKESAMLKKTQHRVNDKRRIETSFASQRLIAPQATPIPNACWEGQNRSRSKALESQIVHRSGYHGQIDFHHPATICSGHAPRMQTNGATTLLLRFVAGKTSQNFEAALSLGLPIDERAIRIKLLISYGPQR